MEAWLELMGQREVESASVEAEGTKKASEWVWGDRSTLENGGEAQRKVFRIWKAMDQINKQEG